MSVDCRQCARAEGPKCPAHIAAERCRWARDQKQWAQKDLAVRASVAGATVGHLESAKPTGGDTKRKIATALGVTIEWLTGREE